MPAERITMRHVREVLRLKFVGGVPTREIARRIGVAASTVRTTLERFHASGLSWPLPEEMTDAMLEARLFANAGTKQGHRRHIEPDWAAIHRELKRKHVTLSILWDEYIEREPQGYRYSRFCELYRSWEAKLSVTMRQTHGRYARILRALGGVQLLILDDWGLEPLDAAARHDLLEILEERYGRRSTIITSQIPVDKWHDLIGDPTYADAILDRIVHNAHRINLTGHSLRRSRASRAAKE